jgi:hypothetical protein
MNMEIGTGQFPEKEYKNGIFIAVCDPENYFVSRLLPVHWKKRPIAEKQSWNKNIDAASGTTFKINKCFQRSKQRLYMYFALWKGIL